MSAIPESASEFFTSYLPQKFQAVSAAVAGKSSAGALVVRVLGEGEWSLRLRAGALVVETGTADDAVILLSVESADFAPLIVEGARLAEATSASPEKQVIAFKALTIAPDRAKLVRSIPGNLVFAVRDGESLRRVAVTPGLSRPSLDDAACKIECAMSDFRDMQSGKLQPLQLFSSGKMKIVGNPQIPMALSTVFV